MFANFRARVRAKLYRGQEGVGSHRIPFFVRQPRGGCTHHVLLASSPTPPFCSFNFLPSFVQNILLLTTFRPSNINPPATLHVTAQNKMQDGPPLLTAAAYKPGPWAFWGVYLRHNNRYGRQPSLTHCCSCRTTNSCSCTHQRNHRTKPKPRIATQKR